MALPQSTGFRQAEAGDSVFYGSEEDAKKAIEMMPLSFVDNPTIKGPITVDDYNGRYVGMFEVMLK